MPAYDGVVSLADSDIPVVIELNNGHVRLTSSGTEIGEWTVEECLISKTGDVTFSISAENETLEFVPSQPGLFAAAVNGGTSEPTPATHAGTDPDVPAAESFEIPEAPEPRFVTRALFYALCALTVALGSWAIVSMVVSALD